MIFWTYDRRLEPVDEGIAPILPFVVVKEGDFGSFLNRREKEGQGLRVLDAIKGIRATIPRPDPPSLLLFITSRGTDCE